MATPMTDINSIEQEIDAAFESNALAEVAWTFLSVVEDHHFKIAVIRPLPDQKAAIFVDGLINAMTYPLRILYKRAPREPTNLDRRYIDAHYGLAQKWLDAAKDYTHFCSIFPLHRAKEINLTVNGDYLEPTDWSTTDLSYEVYDRFIAKRDPERERRLDANPVAVTLRSHIYSIGGQYSIDFSRLLLGELKRYVAPVFESRHQLPDNWQFTFFSLAEYRKVFICLQITAEAWFMARQIVAPGERCR